MAGSSKRKEALLNEYKGNLYEFLVAREISQSCGAEAHFIRGLRPDFHQMLAQQEAFIREYYPSLLIDLPKLAEGLAKEINKNLSERPIAAGLIGKAASGEGKGEADFVLSFNDGEQVPVSIKLSKAQAFVNTKSAGIKSFIGKYFRPFEGVEEKQAEFGAYFDREFDLFSRGLHDRLGLEYDGEFLNWKDSGMTQLPGELPEEGRVLFLKFISSISNKLYGLLEDFFNEKPNQFSICLRPCLGYSVEGMLQATTFYKSQGDNYQLFAHEVENLGKNGKGGLDLIEIMNRPDTSSFDIRFKDRVLQVRIKAMNRFTGKGFKVNCAVKRLS